MAIIKRETTVSATPDAVWTKLIEDPNTWPEWLTPVRQLEERASGPVRKGTEFNVLLGKLGGKIKVTEAVRGARLRWKAGPAMMLAMGMGMQGELTLQRGDGGTRVSLRMVTPMMMAPMMKMMSGLDPSYEMTQTINRIKTLNS